MHRHTLPICLTLLFSLFISHPALAATDNWVYPLSEIDSGHTAWLMISAILVLLMTLPGLALFYGGMVRKKNILSTMMYSFSAAALVSILWMIIAYSLAFTPGNAFIGGLDRLFLNGITPNLTSQTGSIAPNAPNIPETVFMFFQMTFAIIATAIISGSFAERMKFSAMMCFSSAWLMLVYVPVCHWVWGGGFMGDGGVLDYAGGTVVHISAGTAGLVCALVLGKRVGYGKESMPPHNMALTLTGAAMLWVGWFGFNAGSAVAANASAGLAMAVTQISAASGALAWLLCEKYAGHKPSALGLASGAVAGLVGITPAAGFVSPASALLIGALTAIACYFAVVKLKQRFRYDDSLDAFGIHGFGGMIGALLTGLLFNNDLFNGNATIIHQLFIQLKDIIITTLYSGLLSLIILWATGKICRGLRVEHDIEREGLDLNLHGERVE